MSEEDPNRRLRCGKEKMILEATGRKGRLQTLMCLRREEAGGPIMVKEVPLEIEPVVVNY
jgi:hypothetical protein